jgi:hypothetical protein
LDPHDGLAFQVIDGCGRSIVKPGQDHRCLWSERAEKENIALQRFLSLPYWERHWVVQEIYLSSVVVMMYGTRELSWEMFTKPALESGPRLTLDEYRPIFHYYRLVRLCYPEYCDSERADHHEFFHWCYSVLFAKESLCEKPSDKVYGVQALFKKDRRVTIDYTKADSEVYLAALEKWFGEARRLLWPTAFYFLHGSIDLAIGMKLTNESGQRKMQQCLGKRARRRWPKQDKPVYPLLQWDEVRRWIEKYVLHWSSEKAAK